MDGRRGARSLPWSAKVTTSWGGAGQTEADQAAALAGWPEQADSRHAGEARKASRARCPSCSAMADVRWRRGNPCGMQAHGARDVGLPASNYAAPCPVPMIELGPTRSSRRHLKRSHGLASMPGAIKELRSGGSAILCRETQEVESSAVTRSAGGRRFARRRPGDHAVAAARVHNRRRG